MTPPPAPPQRLAPGGVSTPFPRDAVEVEVEVENSFGILTRRAIRRGILIQVTDLNANTGLAHCNEAPKNCV
jgi:hypothetical protein